MMRVSGETGSTTTLEQRLTSRLPTLNPSSVALPVYLAYRGKAKPDADASHAWHPVAYHCLDVAACFDAVLDARPQTLARASTLLGLPPSDARRLLRVPVVLHDIGKFSESFFGQAPALWPDEQGPYNPNHAPKPHTAAGLAFWNDTLRKVVSARIMSGEVFDVQPLLLASFGHHGRPLKGGGGYESKAYFKTAQSRAACASFVSDAIDLLCERPVDIPKGWEKTARRASWWVAGITSLSDWLGSSPRWFPYVEPTMDIHSYWQYAQERARVAVEEAGLVAFPSATLKSFSELTGVAGTPTPVQQWMLDTELPDGGTLVIIEDVTGAGKTEAAQIFVHRLMAAGRASGAYWAMPTQATANAMYERQRKMISALFEKSADRLPSLVLAHGQSKHHEGFRSTVLEHCAPLADAALDTDDEGGEPSTVACAAFLADDRRKGLLADVAAGTIDQALLGVLPSKFNTMRLLGLAEKVLVLDEVHAYDAYMREEIRALLRFQAALGGSAILLSATLPQALRASLVRAWGEGARNNSHRASGQAETTIDGIDVPYPLATVVSESCAIREAPLAAAKSSHRSVPVRFVHDTEDVADRICDAAARGEAVAWIRNTVDSCMEAAELLRDRGLEPVVFHARFAQCDRQTREKEVMAMFGRHSKGPERAQVLVATQVVEQSLDLDFDMLVTDLAPIDLIIQRVGRLWRHARDDRPAGSTRELIVLTPRFTMEPAVDWLDVVLPKTRSVYEDVGVLWRTLRELTKHPSIDTPSGVRALVESVYSDDYVPDALIARVARADGKARAHGGMARGFALRLEDGYCGDFYANWYSDVKIPTRLIDENRVIRLAKVEQDGSIVPWAGGQADDWKAWALSEVRVGAWKIPSNAEALPAYRFTIDAIRKGWPRYEQGTLVLPMTSADGIWSAEIVGDNGTVTATYRLGDGLRL